MKNKAVRWIVAVIVLVLIWSIGGAVFSVSFAEKEMEKYSGLLSLAIGVVVMLLIVNSFDDDDEEEIV